MTAATAGLAQEVVDCFTAYEAALVAGNAAATDRWFADDTVTVRFGPGEEQWGADEVRRWRSRSAPVPAGRHLTDTRVDVWSDTLTVDDTLRLFVVTFRRASQPDLVEDRGRLAHHPRTRLRTSLTR